MVSCRKSLFSRQNDPRRKRTNQKSQEADEDYGDVRPLIDEDEMTRRKTDFMEDLKKSAHELADLEKKTRGQTDSALWFEERRKRITASNFGKICHLRNTTNRIKVVRDMLKTFTSAATNYGIDHEPIALKEFGECMNENIVTCGFFVDFQYNYLGASPDGLIGNDFIVEIKCPYSCRFITVQEGFATGKLKFLESQSGNLRLRKTHNYYFQVQGQLRVTGRSHCYFVVWTPKGLIYDKIDRDDDFFNDEMKDKLGLFFSIFTFQKF